MKHRLNREWLDALPLETKSLDDDQNPIKAIEELSAEITTKFGKLETDLKSATDRLDIEIAKMKRPGTETKANENTVEVKAFETFVRKGREALTPDQVKSLNVSDDTAGGYLAPEQFIAELLRNLTLYSPVRSIARVMGTSSGSVVLSKRTGGMTSQWVGEKQARPETKVTFGQNRYGVMELTAFVDVSNNSLEDSAFDIAQLIAFEFGEEFGTAEGTAFVNGNGVLSPMGFMSDTGLSYTPGGHGSEIKADGLIDLFHAVKTPYRANSVWGMNSTTLAAVRKLKDSSTGTYLLMPAGFNGSPAATILGRPVVEMPDMPNIAADAFPVIFGDFAQGYRIFDRVQLSILRDPYSQATEGMTRFHGRRRVAGGVGKAEAIRKLKIATS